jgi:RNA polymerase sigma-70 factor (ECF subfamily)
MGEDAEVTNTSGESLHSTASLLHAIRCGDEEARDRLFRRYLQPLRRWARGRLPVRARDLVDTDDLVQLTLIRTLNRVGDFEPRRPGAFLSYLRQVLRNQICDEIRRRRRRPDQEPLDERIPLLGLSPLEEVIGKEELEAYEAALSRLPEHHREAVVMRVELGFTYEEVADALGCPTANAARMMIVRSLMRLSESVKERRG